MITFTYQYRLEQAAQDAESKEELLDKVDCIVYDILQEEYRLWGIGRKYAGYGTWHMTLWVNEYRFGRDLAGMLNRLYIITHDEDKVFTLYDFEDVIFDTCWEFAYDKF